MKRLLTILLGLLLCQGAYANIHIEPLIGYKAFGLDNAALYGGTTIGGRLGYSALGLALGGELTQYFNDKGSKEDLTEMAAFVSYDIPVLPFRLLGRYIFDASLDKMYSNITESGSGYGVGVAFTMLPFVEIFLDYNMLNADVAGTSSDVDFKEVMLSVSLPLDF